jgi:hypothetical protein
VKKLFSKNLGKNIRVIIKIFFIFRILGVRAPVLPLATTLPVPWV